MARDDSKLLFSSEWDIDQFFTQGEQTITVGASTTLETTVATFEAMDDQPWMDVSYKIVGGDYWWQPGGLNTPVVADFEGVAAYWKTTDTTAVVGLVNSATSSKDVLVRYYVYTDVRE